MAVEEIIFSKKIQTNNFQYKSKERGGVYSMEDFFWEIEFAHFYSTSKDQIRMISSTEEYILFEIIKIKL